MLLVNALGGFKITPLMDESHIIAVGSRGYLYLGEVAGASARSVEGLELYTSLREQRWIGENSVWRSRFLYTSADSWQQT